jgi:hypothetical protein
LPKKETALKVLKEWNALPYSDKNSKNAKTYAKRVGLRSMLEVRTQAWLEEKGKNFTYEKEVWKYQYEPQKYKPDFNVDGGDITIECKGKLTKEVRKKILAIKDCNPDRKFYLVFEKPDNKINRGSKTSYGDWASKHGIEWGEGTPEPGWFKTKC